MKQEPIPLAESHDPPKPDGLEIVPVPISDPPPHPTHSPSARLDCSFVAISPYRNDESVTGLEIDETCRLMEVLFIGRHRKT